MVARAVMGERCEKYIVEIEVGGVASQAHVGYSKIIEAMVRRALLQRMKD
jgi:hypothetical protein